MVAQLPQSNTPPRAAPTSPARAWPRSKSTSLGRLNPARTGGAGRSAAAAEEKGWAMSRSGTERREGRAPGAGAGAGSAADRLGPAYRAGACGPAAGKRGEGEGDGGGGG